MTGVIPRLPGMTLVTMPPVEHHFTGPSYTLGIEEELWIVDAETLDLTNAIEGLLEDLGDDRESRARSSPS